MCVCGGGLYSWCGSPSVCVADGYLDYGLCVFLSVKDKTQQEVGKATVRQSPEDGVCVSVCLCFSF